MPIIKALRCMAHGLNTLPKGMEIHGNLEELP